MQADAGSWGHRAQFFGCVIYQALNVVGVELARDDNEIAFGDCLSRPGKITFDIRDSLMP